MHATFYLIGKRALDLSVASIAFILCAPILVIVAALIRLSMGKPVLFRQVRSGINGCRFTILKFRTMLDTVDASGCLLPDSDRLTRVGRLVRDYSLDELPQLWNVLKGEMSVVGPRPLLPQYDSRYNSMQRRRLEVMPGVTGWAQIHGRNELLWEEKFKYDLWYVNHRSLALDVGIILMTVLRVVQRRGIRATDHASMPEFQGSSEARPQ
jgi:sugar transferase EpsL